MSNYTKSTWTVEDNGDCWDIIGGADWIATVISGYDGDEANAHLIAAAPEMLEALERILRYQTNDPYIDSICQRAINKAKEE